MKVYNGVNAINPLQGTGASAGDHGWPCICCGARFYSLEEEFNFGHKYFHKDGMTAGAYAGNPGIGFMFNPDMEKIAKGGDWNLVTLELDGHILLISERI